MGISKFVNGPSVLLSLRSEGRGCDLGVADCMFSSNGSCMAEWCIFKELPKLNGGSRKMKCPLCDEESEASLYSGGGFVLCKKCSKKLQDATNGSCIVCGIGLTDDEVVICKECAKKIKESIKEEKICTICSISYEGKSDICTVCANKIKEKINE